MIRIPSCTKTRFLGLLFASVCGFGTNALADSEAPLLKETFESEEQFTDHFKPDSKPNWKVEDAVIVAERGGTANAILALDPDCVVEVDVSFEADPEAPDGFAGIRLGGNNGSLFVLKSNGFWRIYHEQGEQRALGQLTQREIEPGKLYRFRITRQASNDGYSFIWEVDGELIAEFTQITPPDGEDPSKLALFAWRGKAQYDNITIHRLEPGAESNP